MPSPVCYSSRKLRPTATHAPSGKIHDRHRIDEAKDAFSSAIVLDKDLPTADFRVEALLGRALAESALGEERKAEGDYNRALASMPEHPAVLTRVAMNHHRRKRF